MNGVYRGDGFDGRILFLERPDGMFDAFDTRGARYTVLALPDTAVELLDPDGGRAALLDEVRAALDPVRMSKTARAAVTDALDALDPE